MAKEKLKKEEFEKPDVEYRLRERERFLRMLITNLPGVVFRSNADAEFTKTFVSEGCFDLTGCSAKELIGENAVAEWNDLIHKDDRERFFTDLQHLNENREKLDGKQFQISYRLVSRDEKVRHVRELFRFVHDSAGNSHTLEGFIIDITDRTLADERIRKSEARYKLLAENMRDLVCLHDLDGTCLYVSPSSEMMLGYLPHELVGTSPQELIHPQDIELVRDAAHSRLVQGKISSIVIEYRMHDKKGDYYWFETMAQTVAGEDGKIVQLQTVSRDITERKKIEDDREKGRRELAKLFISEQTAHQEAGIALVKAEHASRAKDEFLQMVSHEFRTPLTTIKTLVRVLQHGGNSEAERDRHLETIAAECDRQVDVILNLLDVSRFDEGDVDLKQEPVDINRVLNSCDKIERPATDAREQSLTIEFDESLPPVCGDEKAIRRALCTIIENAVKYTPVGGKITVATEHFVYHKLEKVEGNTKREAAAEIFGDLPKQMEFSDDEDFLNDEIAVVITDNGRGILPADLPKIFQKFYRGAKPHHDASTDGTPDDAAGKAETPGVGLGLYLAERLINALGGRITVTSEVGKGSCFTVFLQVWNEDLHESDTIDEYGFDEN